MSPFVQIEAKPMAAETIANPKQETAVPSKKLITGEEFFRMPNIGSAELIAGEIVTHMPTGHPHGFIESMIAFFLNLFIRQHKLGRVLTGEVGIYTRRNPDQIRAADVAFISHERLSQAQEEGFLDVAPELIVEIMSPANTWTEAQEKLAEYFAIGVNVVWIVDPQLEQVHVYRSVEQFKLLQKQDELTSEEILPGFSVALTEIFDAE
jgi:Uma2 family endonuclease